MRSRVTGPASITPALCPVPHAARDALTCRSGGEARRDGATWTPRTSRTHPHHLVLALQTDDLVLLLVSSDLAAAQGLAPGLDLHTLFAELTDQSHVCSCLMLQHPPLHRRRSHLLRMKAATSPAEKASSTPHTALDPGAIGLSAPLLHRVSLSRVAVDVAVRHDCRRGCCTAARGW